MWAGECPYGDSVRFKGSISVTAMQHEDWTMRAKCRGMEDALFPEASDQKRARLLCSGCPVRFECLSEALDNRIEWGIWGGMTENQRRRLRRQHPATGARLAIAADAPATEATPPTAEAPSGASAGPIRHLRLVH